MKTLAPGLELGVLLLTSVSTWGQDWVLTSAPVQSWTAIACSSDATKLVAAASSIYVSTNFGSTWTETTAPSNRWSWVHSTPDGTKLMGASYDGKLYVSTNSGAVWASGNPIPLRFDVSGWGIASSADGKMLVVGEGNYYTYTSKDYGATWTTTSPSNYCLYSSVACSADGTKLLAFAAEFCNFWNTNVYISTDSGASWLGLTTEYAPLSAPIGEYCALTGSADGTEYVAAGPLAGIYISTNSGFDWQMTSAPADGWTSIATSADGTKLVATASINTLLGFPGDIWTSADAGVTWVRANAPTNNWVAVASSADGSRLAAAVAGGGIYVWGTAPPTPPPVLNIQVTDGYVTLSWTGASNFVLEENSNLEATNWIPNPTTPMLTNGQYQVVLPVSSSTGFFRLKN